ncbi:MAG: hypothetical protein LBK98_05965 [Peptococcaceae bacterium]|jgi:flagellar hook assembly protein FlgD|nr:hypothetical protein [Peptococcaceae bacterium]
MAIEGTQRTTGNQYNAVFTDKTDNSSVDPMDFLNLMIAQMKNQDFMNPMDDTQFVTQMAQFSTMRQMQDLAEYSKTNYAMSLIGKTVTATRFTVGGALDTATGPVQKVSLVDNEYVLYIAGKKYTLSQIMSAQAEGAPTFSLDGLSLTAEDDAAGGISVTWSAPTEDETVSGGLRYSVYYSETGPFDTVEAVKAGTLYGEAGRAGLKGERLRDLPAGKYFVNVLVKDSVGSEQVYQPTQVTF